MIYISTKCYELGGSPRSDGLLKTFGLDSKTLSRTYHTKAERLLNVLPQTGRNPDGIVDKAWNQASSTCNGAQIFKKLPFWSDQMIRAAKSVARKKVTEAQEADSEKNWPLTISEIVEASDNRRYLLNKLDYPEACRKQHSTVKDMIWVAHSIPYTRLREVIRSRSNSHLEVCNGL